MDAAVALLGRILNGHRTIHGGDHAGEFHQRAVAHQFELPAVVNVHMWIEDADAIGLQPFHRAGFVGLHQAAVTHDIGGQDGGQFALHQALASSSAATRASAAASMVLKRGSSRRTSSAGSALACLRNPLFHLANTGPSISSAVSLSLSCLKRVQAKLYRIFMLSGSISSARFIHSFARSRSPKIASALVPAAIAAPLFWSCASVRSALSNVTRAARDRESLSLISA